MRSWGVEVPGHGLKLIMAAICSGSNRGAMRANSLPARLVTILRPPKRNMSSPRR